MFSARKFIAGLGIAAGGIALAGAAQAGVVVKATGPSAAQYPVGKKLDDAASITLKAGDSVTILDATGTRVVKGPGTVTVGAKGAAKRSTFAVLTRQRSATQVRTGAVRAGGSAGPVRNPNLWYVNVDQPGTICLADSANVQLWRASSTGDATYMLSSARSPDHVHIAFADGSTVAGWDSERMPISDGGSYVIMSADEKVKNEVKFVTLATPADNPEDLAAQLVEKGCTAQLEQLSTALMTG